MYPGIRSVVVLAFAMAAFAPTITVAQQTQSLNAFINQTIELHPAIKAAERALSKALAERAAAGQYPNNPEFEIGYEKAGEKTTEFGISQTVDVWNRRGAYSTVADANVAAARARYDLLETELLEGLLLALGEIRKQHGKLRLAQKRLSLSEKFLEVTRRFVAAGDSGQNDLLAAEINKSNAELQVAAVQSDLAEAQRSLIELVGQDRNLWPIPPRVDPGLSMKFESNTDKAPELRLAQAILAMSKAGITVADKERLPDPTIGVSIGEEGESTLYGLTFSVPIPVWNRGTAEKLAASEGAAESEFLVADTRRRLHARSITAERNFNTALAVVVKWRRQTAPALLDQERLIGRLIESREINSLEYLQQLNQLIGTEELGMDLEESLWRAFVVRLRVGSQLRNWLENMQ